MTADQLRIVDEALHALHIAELHALVDRTCDSGDPEAQVELALAIVREAEHVCTDVDVDEPGDGACPGYELVLQEAGHALTRGDAPQHPCWPYAVGVLQLAHRRLNGKLNLARVAS